MKKNPDHFKINEVSKLYHIGIDSLRYYEKIGLLIPARGENNRYRYYSHRDLMKLNLIMELRELNFSFIQIKEMLGSRNLDMTRDILSNELNSLTQKMNQLQHSIDITQYRINGIQNALSDIRYDRIFIMEQPERNCLHIGDGDITQNEIDYYLIRFLNHNGCSLSDTIGRSDGYRLDTGHLRADGNCVTKEVFLVNNTFSVPVSFVLPAGSYLTAAYSGSATKSGFWSRKLLEYAKDHQLKLEGDMFEFYIIDYYETDLESEFLTLVQIKIVE